jgi:hypothetical protein
MSEMVGCAGLAMPAWPSAEKSPRVRPAGERPRPVQGSRSWCIQMHIKQTKVQIERGEQALEKLQARPGRKVCEAMRGLVEEAQHEIEEHEKGPILDLVIVAGMQRIEHYEIAAYGTDVTLAKALGEGEGCAPWGDVRAPILGEVRD